MTPEEELPVPSRGADDGELVGVGGYALRIEPAAALIPGRGDPARLMAVWFLRKSVYWMVGVGIGVGSVLDRTVGSNGGFDFDGSPDEVVDYLVSWYGLAIAAILTRFIAGWAALALAYPLATAHEVGLAPRTNFGSSIGRFLDRMHVARAFRSLRWTHHVRQVGLARLGRTGDRLRRLDPILDIVNIVSIIVGFTLLIAIESTRSSV